MVMKKKVLIGGGIALLIAIVAIAIILLLSGGDKDVAIFQPEKDSNYDQIIGNEDLDKEENVVDKYDTGRK